MKNQQLTRAIEIMGVTQGDFAKLLGRTKMAVSAWHRNGVPVKYCVLIERLTGGQINRRDLRHDSNDIWESLD